MRNLLSSSVVAMACSCASATPPLVESREDPATAPVPAPPPTIVSASVSSVSPVELHLFMMSQCPYASLMLQQLPDVMKQFGPDVRLKVDYIGKRKGDGTLESMHGPAEVKGDLVQLCAMAHSTKWLEMMVCQSQDHKNTDTNWERCAEALGISTRPLVVCSEGPEGRKLLEASFDVATKNEVTGSPTLFVGGVKYVGPRRKAAYMRAICDSFPGGKSAGCSSIPAAPNVNVRLLVDARCTDTSCGPKKLEDKMKSMFDAPKITTLDVSTSDGRKLFDSLKPIGLPAAIFDETLANDPDVPETTLNAMTKSGPYKLFAGSWNPACADPEGCSLAECKLKPVCRSPVPNKLEVFLMSKCPYGVKAVVALEEVMKNFKKSGAQPKLVISFIGKGTKASGLTSMHGPNEVAEDLRQVCAIKHYPRENQYLDYIVCRAKEPNSDEWEPCARSSRIDTATLAKCADGDEGKLLLEKSFAYSEATGFRGSPTWLVNDKFRYQGLEAQTIKKNLCAHNTLPGCENELTGPPKSTGGGQCGP